MYIIHTTPLFAMSRRYHSVQIPPYLRVEPGAYLELRIDGTTMRDGEASSSTFRSSGYKVLRIVYSFNGVRVVRRTIVAEGASLHFY